MAAIKQRPGTWILWGAELSPFALKVEALLRYYGLPFEWQPRTGGFLRALRFAVRRAAVVAGRLPLTAPEFDPLDEFPLVPFLFGPDGENLYDSSAIGTWLDARCRPPNQRVTPLLPVDDPALRFSVRLVDEALDEVGLYLVHHNRWVVAARDNGAGARLAAEMRPLWGPLAPLLRRAFPGRQCRRLPYLFSVAPADDSAHSDVPTPIRPPARREFPPTHALLDHMYESLLACVEPIFEARPFLFGSRFTLADASLYGQIGMNLHDVSARRKLAHLAPATEAWILRLAQGDFTGHEPDGSLEVDTAAEILLDWAGKTFVSLMKQNLAAYERHSARGETVFNERAFDQGRSLYDGTLLGHPFRSVAKTFQVRVWRALLDEWESLAPADRARLPAILQEEHGLG